VAAAHGLLAAVLERRGQLAPAIIHAEEALGLQSAEGPVRVALRLQLASVLAAAGVESRAAEASRLLDEVLDSGVDPDPMQRFAYVTARARLAHAAGDEDRAAAYARAALRLLTDAGPLADLSAARRDAATRSELERVAASGRADAVVAGVEVPRDPDGSVRWTWALIRRLDRSSEDRRTYGSWEDAAAPLLQSLEAQGFRFDDLDALQQAGVASDEDLRRLAPVLVHWLGRIEHPGVRAAIVYALDDRRAAAIAVPALLNLYRGLRGRPAEQVLEDALVAVLTSLLSPAQFDDLVELLRERGLRSPLLAVLPQMGHPAEAEKLALDALDEDEDHTVAIRVLGELRSKAARPAIERVAGREPPQGGGDAGQAERARIRAARQALERIDS
jgi:tetratricopeptide (TPR) repeat protein